MATVHGTRIIYPEMQCGMNFISNLALSNNTKMIIDVLDRAFSEWGDGSGVNTPDLKSQVFFTDNVANSYIWSDIKKICTRGPVTHNRRYPQDTKRKIAVYILTWDKYSEWRAKQEIKEKKEPEPKKEEIKF